MASPEPSTIQRGTKLFTGIVEEVGTVRALVRQAASARISIACPSIAASCSLGDSVCVSGVCLTVVETGPGVLAFDAVAETLALSTLGKLRNGSVVNLERALRADGRFGGHIVQGHVDGQARITSVAHQGEALVLTLECDSAVMRYIVYKGSVAVDGTSLTVAGVEGNRFSIWLIPHSQKSTTLGAARAGTLVNIETDIVARYIERFQSRDRADGVNLETLFENGFGV